MKVTAEGRREDVILELAAEILRSHGRLQSAASGSSMLPSIFPGDVLVVSRASVCSVRCGDIVLFFRGGRFCAHRLVGKAEESGRRSLITRGDALLKNDFPVAEHELLGRVTGVIRGGRHIELGAHLDASGRLLRSTLRRSHGAVRWLLRWHSLRTRLRCNSGPGFGKVAPKHWESI